MYFARYFVAFGALFAVAQSAPASHLQTLLWWDCDGTFRSFPDNPLLSAVVQIPKLPRVYEAGAKGLFAYIKAHCDAIGGSPNSTEQDFLNNFLNRFMPLHAAAHINRLFKEDPVGFGDANTTSGLGRWMCVDSLDTFTRDLIKYWEALTADSGMRLPESCQYYKLQKGDARYTGECLAAHSTPFSAQLQLKIQQCPSSEFGYFRGSVGCAGADCSIGRPCSTAAGCGAGSTLVCSDVFDYPAGDPIFTEEDIFERLRTIRLFGPTDSVGTPCGAEYGPRKLLKSFIERFAKLIPGTPEATGAGSSCQGTICRVCLPEKTSTFTDWYDMAFKDSATQQAGYPKPRGEFWNGSGECAELLDNWDRRFKTQASQAKLKLFPRVWPRWTAATPSERLSQRLTPYVGGYGFYARGTPYQLGGMDTVIGGGACSSDADCNTITDEQLEYISASPPTDIPNNICETLADFCNRSSPPTLSLGDNGEAWCAGELCVRDTSDTTVWRCIPRPGLNIAKKACACLARGYHNQHVFLHGARCELATTIPLRSDQRWGIEGRKKKWMLKDLASWDGAAAADGLDPLSSRDHWVDTQGISTTAPKGESHLASWQCDGTLHVFQDTPYAAAARHALLPDIVAWGSDFAWSTWQCRDPGMSVDQYRVANTLLWRPEAWLWAKVVDLDSYSVPQPPNNTVFPSLLFSDYFIKRSRTHRSMEVKNSVYNWEQLVLFTANFSLSTWASSALPDSASRYMGIKWTGTRAALGNDFSATGRLEECKAPHSAGGGLVRVDITCSGEACTNFLRFSTMCTREGDTCPGSIGVPLICKPVFSVLWDRDVVAEQLWGSRKREVPWSEFDQKLYHYLNGDWGNAPVFARTSRCPVLEPMGKARLSTKLTDTMPLLYKAATEVFAAAKDRDCQYCGKDDCSGECKWDPSGKCVSATVRSTRPLWCFPDAWTVDNLSPTYSALSVNMPSVQAGGSLRPECPLMWFPCYTVYDLRDHESELVPKAELVAPQDTRCRRTMSPTGAPSEAPSFSPSTPPTTGIPTAAPSAGSVSPTGAPSEGPTSAPSFSPSTPPTTGIPTAAPSAGPSGRSSSPTRAPSGVCGLLPDESPCSLGNILDGGRCTAGHCIDRCAKVTCPVPDSCHSFGQCDPATGVCTDPMQPDGHACDDGDATTVKDACHAGACRGTAVCEGVECKACDPRCARAQCDAPTGQCMEQPVADGAACNDGSSLTNGDQCVDGVCLGTPDRCAGTHCVPVSQCHVAGVCDPATGRCSEPPIANGTACDDSNHATVSDSCSGGTCIGILPCGNITCDPSQGGLVDPRCHIPKCTSGGDACSSPSERPDGTPCADGRPGTTGEQCVLGSCRGQPDLCAGVRCMPPSPCHGKGRCDASTGECVDQPLADGTLCSDGDPATGEDACAAGVCAGSLKCAQAAGSWFCSSPPSACHHAACGISGCVIRMRDCVPCSDGDPGTAGDTCRGGACIGVNVSSTRPPPVPGTAAFDRSSVSFSAAALASGFLLEIVVVLSGDHFAGLENGTMLQVGLSGDANAAVWLGGTREAVVKASSARVIPPDRMVLSIRTSEALVPKRRETVSVMIRPGMTASGLPPVGYTNFELVPQQQPIDGAVHRSLPAAPGIASLALKLRQCTDDQEPEEDLDRVTSPTGLHVGAGPMAAYNGALIANAIILTVFTMACGGLYAYLTKQAMNRAQQDGVAPVSRHRRLAAARFGSFIYPLTFLYPSSNFTAARVLFYGAGFYQVLAGVIFVLCTLFPVFVIRTVRKAESFATVVPCTDHQSRLMWFLYGSESWEGLDKSSGHQVYRLFYEGYRFRDRYLLALDLLLNQILAVLQSIRPRSERQCTGIGYSVFGLMLLYALYVTFRCSCISPFELLCMLLVLWAEVTCKLLLISVGYGHANDHWAVAAASTIAEVAYAILVLQAVVVLCLFFAGEYGNWASNSGGGKDIAGRGTRVARFGAFWFAFCGVTAAMFGAGDESDDGSGAQRGAAPEELEEGGGAVERHSPAECDYTLMQPVDEPSECPGSFRSPPASVLQLGPRTLPLATRAAPLEVTMQMGSEAKAAGVSLEQLAVAQIPDDALPPASSSWGAALRAARAHACGLRASSSEAERSAAREAHTAAVAATEAERSAAVPSQLRAAEALLRTTSGALRGYGRNDAPPAAGAGSGSAVTFRKPLPGSPLAGFSPASAVSPSSILGPGAGTPQPGLAGSGVARHAPRSTPLSPITGDSIRPLLPAERCLHSFTQACGSSSRSADASMRSPLHPVQSPTSPVPLLPGPLRQPPHPGGGQPLLRRPNVELQRRQPPPL